MTLAMTALVAARDVLGLDHGALNSRILGEERAGGDDSPDGPFLY